MENWLVLLLLKCKVTILVKEQLFQAQLSLNNYKQFSNLSLIFY